MTCQKCGSHRTLGPHGIPYGFTLRGRYWRVRWGNPPDEKVLASSEWGECNDTERIITLDASLRRRDAADKAFRGVKVTLDRGKVARYTDTAHSRIYLLELPLAALFMELAGQFRKCVCPKKRKKSSVESSEPLSTRPARAS